jgi:hypothetical protein
MIPDELQRQSGPVAFRDSDGCRVFPGCADWASDDDGLPGDGRYLHHPLTLGEVGQFELALDCHTLDTDSELTAEERDLEALLDDPVIADLVRRVLERFPSDGGELAFEVDA